MADEFLFEERLHLSLARDVKAAVSPNTRVIRGATIARGLKGDDDWVECHIVMVDWSDMGGQQSTELGSAIIQVSAYSRLAEVRADRRSSMHWKLAARILRAMKGKTFSVQRLDESSSDYIGCYTVDNGRVDRIPANSSRPGIVGAAITFNAAIQTVNS